MKIKLLKPYQLHPINEIWDCPDTVAVALIDRKVAEKIDEDQPKITKRQRKVKT